MEHITRRGFIGLTAAAAASALVGVPACSPPSQAPSQTPASPAAPESSSSTVQAASSGSQLACGGQSGVYWARGQQLASAVSGAPSASPLEAFVSDGAVANVRALAAGSATFAFCQADVAACARDGEGPFDEPVPVVEAAVLYDEFLQLAARDSRLRTPADLKGKRVSMGVPGSGTYYNALSVLSAYGLTEDDLTPTYQSFGDAAASLAEGRTDAAFFVAGVPTPALAELFASSEGARLVAFDKAHREALVAASPQLAEATIPAGAYAGLERNVSSVSVRAVLLAAEEAPQAEIAQIASALAPSEPVEGQPAESGPAESQPAENGPQEGEET